MEELDEGHVRWLGERSSVGHPVWLRLCHWTNVLAILVMIGSGWRIYNAAPFFNFTFPKSITLGGWLGGALQWHFAFMWLLVGNGLLYISISVVSGRFSHRFLPISVSELGSDIKKLLRLNLSHDDLSRYNSIQKLAYVAVIVDLVVIVISGLALWKSVQFPLIRELVGGYESARRLHFFSMTFLVLFFVGHVFMVVLVPKTLLLMIRGR